MPVTDTTNRTLLTLIIDHHEDAPLATAQDVAGQLLGALDVGADPDQTPAMWCAATHVIVAKSL